MSTTFRSKKIVSLEDFSIQKNQGRETFSAMLDLSGKPVEIKGEGDGVLDAFIEGLKRALNIDFEVMEYGEHALGQRVRRRSR
jgi:2-isopropylmalate synthase